MDGESCDEGDEVTTTTTATAAKYDCMLMSCRSVFLCVCRFNVVSLSTSSRRLHWHFDDAVGCFSQEQERYRYLCIITQQLSSLLL